MLILARRPGETIVIDGVTRITLLNISGNQVKLGIDAPKTVCVHREEIHQKVLDQQTVEEETP